jgi:adenosylcobinamide kinase / adenosylcobinamide-phosphate guanylyltransferase
MDALLTTMEDTTLIIGGCRSGKSGHALDLGERSAGRRNLFVATGQAGDPEMEKRIERHKIERGDRWQTVEEPVDIVGTLEQLGPGSDIVIIDCLTLWTSNLMMSLDTDEDIIKEMHRLTQLITEPPCPIILVSNEVGLGIVPENPLARRFRDLTGWCNQRVSHACNRVVWMVAGIPVTIKPSSGAPC